MPKRKLSDFLRQNNTRGFGLASDVKAGRARPVPAAYVRQRKRPPISGRRTRAR